MKLLHLENNLIENIDLNAFSINCELEYIDLSNNTLTYTSNFNEELFINCHELGMLEISGKNRIDFFIDWRPRTPSEPEDGQLNNKEIAEINLKGDLKGNKIIIPHNSNIKLYIY